MYAGLFLPLLFLVQRIQKDHFIPSKPLQKSLFPSFAKIMRNLLQILKIII